MSVEAFDWIGYQADVRPGATALIDDYTNRSFSYAELDVRVRGMAVWLQHRGVGGGDRVTFLSANTTDIFDVLFACAHLGAILVPLNWRLAVPELQFIVGDSEPKVLIYEDQFSEAVAQLNVAETLALGEPYEEALRAYDPAAAPAVVATHDDPWAIMYTSGTTGHPKGAIITLSLIHISEPTRPY